MNEKKIKSFLINGFAAPAEEEAAEAPKEAEETPDTGEEAFEETGEEPIQDGRLDQRLESIEDELLKMRYILEDLRDREPAPQPDMSPYLTTKEQMKAVQASVERKEVEVSNKALVAAMEQIAVMREDFFRLCQSMKDRIGEMTPQDVLSSFEAYEVDMENILRDGGVYIGPFEYERLNTIHQRIVGVIETDDREKDGTIAERHTEGYKLGNRVILKEKVSVFKYAAPAAETPSETDSETASEDSVEEQE